MNIALASRIDHLFGIAGTSPAAVAVIEERLAVLQPRMPWLYAMMLSCQVGMVFTFELERRPPLVVVIVALLTALRGAKWLSLKRDVIVGEAARKRLRAIGIASLVTSAIFMLVIAQFLPSQPPEKRQLMMVMTATCTIALAMPMSALPTSARLTYILFGIPAAVVGTLAGNERAAAVASFNLLLVNIILIALLKLQDRSFVEQVETRLAGEQARKRAEKTAQKALEEGFEARELAASDFLTGLANRRAFLGALDDRGATDADSSLMLLDLDGFKGVNDTFGHDVGDKLLVIVAERLRAWSIDGAVTARLGGDEFAVLMRGMTGIAVERMAQALVDRLSAPYPIGDAIINISSCCGIAILPAGDRDPSNALRAADLALYRAKDRERGSVVHYTSDMGADVKRRDAIESALRTPGVEQDIQLLYQPIVKLDDGQIVAFEALARWNHSHLGAIAPSDFIPMTEQLQLVEQISQALLARAARAALAWAPEQCLSFNLSAVQLCSGGSAQQVLQCIGDAGLAPARLQIEVTETAMMADFATARHNLATLQESGVRVALDDFGSGHTSINYLREMRFDELKLDGSFLAALHTSHGAGMLKGLVDLAHAIGTPCTAEHVETAAHLEFLATIGCEYGQGYFFGQPVPADVAARLAYVPVVFGKRGDVDRARRFA